MRYPAFSRSFLLFGIAGTIGFIVDTGVLYLIREFAGNYWGRMISFFCAVLVTWVINRHFAFAHRESGATLLIEFYRYFAAMLGGGAVNYLVYALLVYSIDEVAAQPVWGVAAGSIAGMFVNYLSAKHLIFRHNKISDIINE